MVTLHTIVVRWFWWWLSSRASVSVLPSPPAATILPRKKAAAKSALLVFNATVSSDFSQAPGMEQGERERKDSWSEQTCGAHAPVCVCVCARSHKVAEVNSWGSVVHLQPDRTLLSFQCDLHKQVTQEAAAVRRGVHTLFPTHTQSYIYTHTCQVLKKVRTNRQRKEAGQVKDGDVVVKMMPVERLLNASGLCWRNNNNSN